MIRPRLGLLAGWLALASASVGPAAAPSPSEAVLKEKGLRRQGSQYVLPAEVEFAKRVAAARSLSRGLGEALAQQDAMAQMLANRKLSLRQLTQQRMLLSQQLSQSLPAEEHNRLLSAFNVVTDQINLLNDEGQEPEAAKLVQAEASNRREAYVQAILDLRALADSTSAAYETLAVDAEVTEALSELGRSSKTKPALGPSRTYLANLKLLEKAESTILTETIPLRSDNGIFWVDVTINGKTTISMIFDTGASTLSMGAEEAAKVGITPGPDAPSIPMSGADGSSHSVKMVNIASVRVGKFAVENVECAVVDETKSNVPPLLGGPFLKHFTFKMNQAARTVTFTKIEDPETPSRVPARKKAATAARKKRGARKP